MNKQIKEQELLKEIVKLQGQLIGTLEEIIAFKDKTIKILEEIKNLTIQKTRKYQECCICGKYAECKWVDIGAGVHFKCCSRECLTKLWEREQKIRDETIEAKDKELHQHITEHFIKRGCPKCKVVFKQLIKQERQKIIDMIDKRIDKLENMDTECPTCDWKGRENDAIYDSDACEISCPACNSRIDYKGKEHDYAVIKALIEIKEAIRK